MVEDWNGGMVGERETGNWKLGRGAWNDGMMEWWNDGGLEHHP
jgi:hypothetical protein